MHRQIRRASVAGGAVALFAALAAAVALAAPTSTGSATQVTATGATLNGAVATGGRTTYYSFQWGTTTAYGHTTPIGTIPAGKGTVAVFALIKGLRPYTTYHFRLASQQQGSTSRPYYSIYNINAYGQDLTFKTRRIGNVTLQHGKLTVFRHRARTLVVCNSTVSCAGREKLALTIKFRGRSKSVNCGSAKFSLRAGRKGFTTIKLNGTCITLLQIANHRTLPGKLSAAVTSGQPNTSSKVSVKYKS